MQMTTFQKLALTVLLLASVLLSGCRGQTAPRASGVEDPWGNVEIPRGQAIRIGIGYDVLDEGLDRQSEDLLRGAELAVDDIGRIYGFEVDLVPIRSECSAEGGSSGASAISSNPLVVGIIGPACSSACIAAAPIFEETNLTMISPACGASVLTDQVTHGGSFMRTMYDDALEAGAAARFAYLELGARQVAAVHDGTADSTGLVESFAAAFGSLGGVVVRQEQIIPGAEDVGLSLGFLADEEIDLIYAPLLPGDAARLTSQRVEAGLAEIPVLGGRHYWSEWFLRTVDEAGEGIYASGPVVEGANYDALVNSYRARYDQRPSSVLFAYSYDATQLMLNAIQQVAASGPNEELIIGRQTLHDALYNTSTFDGATGTLTCTTWGDCSAPRVGIAKVQDNKWVVVYMP